MPNNSRDAINTELQAIRSSMDAFAGGKRCGILDSKKLSEEQLTEEELTSLMTRIKNLYKLIAADVRGKITTLSISSIGTATESPPHIMLARYLTERGEELNELLLQLHEATELYDDIQSSLSELKRRLREGGS
jgi:hypothetical protein